MLDVGCRQVLGCSLFIGGSDEVWQTFNQYLPSHHSSVKILSLCKAESNHRAGSDTPGNNRSDEKMVSDDVTRE